MPEGKAPTIITRPAKKGEKLTTLDNVERELDDFTVLVCDTAGALSLAGVMGGLESEVTETTTNVLLEGASWNFVNTRRTVSAQRLNSEAAYRFARGVHPALAELGVRVGLDRIAAWSGGEIAQGLVDEYPQKEIDPVVTITHAEITRRLGMEVDPKRIISLLQGLEFGVTLEGDTFTIQTPPHRLDIHPGVIGKADIVEEIARMVGFDNISATRLAELMPPIHPQPLADAEEKVRNTLVRLGLQEIITYRLTEPSAEARLTPPGYRMPHPDPTWASATRSHPSDPSCAAACFLLCWISPNTTAAPPRVSASLRSGPFSCPAKASRCPRNPCAWPLS